MRLISLIFVLLRFKLSRQSEEYSNPVRPFKDCIFIDDSFKSVKFIFDDFNEDYTWDKCLDLISDENIAQNVQFAKFSGFIIDKTHKTIQQPDVDYFFENFQGIRALDLSHNRIKSLNSLTLNSSKLELINLSHNQLSQIPEDLFLNTPNLTEIDLSFNKIGPDFYSSHEGIFGLKELSVIDLRNNNIEFIYDAFEENEKLHILRLDNNPIRVNCYIFTLFERSVSIGVSWEAVKFLDTKCMGNKLKITVDHDEIVIRLLENHRALRINKMNFSKLRWIYFGANQLENVSEMLELLSPSLYALSLNGNSIGNLTVDTFQRFKELEWLYLSQTNLPEFDCDPFEKLTNLKYLDISKNNLKVLNATILSSTLKKLALLSIGGNNLENIDEIIPYLNPHIGSLDLSENYVKNVDASIFARFPHLWDLKLNGINLTNFDMNALRHMELLTALDISENNLENADFSLQEPLKRLKVINLDRNNLTELKGINAVTYPALKYLFIKDNPVTCEYIANMKWKRLEVIGQPCSMV